MGHGEPEAGQSTAPASHLDCLVASLPAMTAWDTRTNVIAG